MMPPKEWFNTVKTSLFKTYSNDAGKMLLHTGTLAWITSAAAQIFGIVNNDKVSKKQKKFLIPQEIADAAINIFSFYLVTNSIQNFTKKLVSKGRILTPEIKRICKDNGIKFAKEAGEETLNIGKTILDNIKEFKAAIKVNDAVKIGLPENKLTLETKIAGLNDLYDHHYAPFESGAKIIGGLIGAVLSSNIITPMLRNPLAAMKQKEDIARDDKLQTLPAPSAPILPAYNRLGIEDYKKQASLNVTRPSASLKI